MCGGVISHCIPGLLVANCAVIQKNTSAHNMPWCKTERMGDERKFFSKFIVHHAERHRLVCLCVTLVFIECFTAGVFGFRPYKVDWH